MNIPIDSRMIDQKARDTINKILNYAEEYFKIPLLGDDIYIDIPYILTITVGIDKRNADKISNNTYIIYLNTISEEIKKVLIDYEVTYELIDSDRCKLTITKK